MLSPLPLLLALPLLFVLVEVIAEALAVVVTNSHDDDSAHDVIQRRIRCRMLLTASSQVFSNRLPSLSLLPFEQCCKNGSQFMLSVLGIISQTSSSKSQVGHVGLGVGGLDRWRLGAKLRRE